MSWENYERSMELAPKCRFYTTAGGRSIEEIEAVSYTHLTLQTTSRV